METDFMRSAIAIWDVGAWTERSMGAVAVR